MKLCLAQTRPVKGDFDANLANHIDLIAQAAAQQADLIVFPELSLTGYEPTLAAELATSAEDPRFAPLQALAFDHQLTIAVGMPLKADDGTTISMLIFQPNQPLTVYSKQYLHADEEPFFVSGDSIGSVPVKGHEVGFAICYELSIAAHAEAAHASGAQLYLASVAKTEAGVAQASQRLADIARTYAIPALMVNSAGPSDNFMGAGSSAVWNAEGELVAQLDAESEGLLFFEVES